MGERKGDINTHALSELFRWRKAYSPPFLLHEWEVIIERLEELENMASFTEDLQTEFGKLASHVRQASTDLDESLDFARDLGLFNEEESD